MKKDRYTTADQVKEAARQAQKNALEEAADKNGQENAERLRAAEAKFFAEQSK